MSTGQTIVLWLLVAWTTLGAILGIAFIGRPRKALTPGGAVVILLVDALVIAGILYVGFGKL